MTCTKGSSPLSRGIRGRDGSLMAFGGIIPALAGNTVVRSPVSGSAGDHPRSRGEYQTSVDVNYCYNGSSPLSRGILRVLFRRPLRRRIIPALAGNTAHRYTGPHGCGDHPRSRGEYHCRFDTNSLALGSSPLSRGIRPRLHWRQTVRRIIPALAGNTKLLGGWCSAAGDHPRSRGEYVF